jgi:eukaryotic-like serine/threonine-protein kinase
LSASTFDAGLARKKAGEAHSPLNLSLVTCYAYSMGFWKKIFGKKEPPPTPSIAPPQNTQAQLAEAWIDAAVQAEQLTAAHFIGLLEALLAAGKQSKVITLLRRALVRFPEHVPTLMRLAEIAVDRHELEAATPALRAITHLGDQEERVRAHFMLGELAERAGQKPEARAHYEAILALDFHYPLARERALRLAEEQAQPDSSYVQHTITQGVNNSAIGRFVLQRELGRGGAGAVYLATDNQLHRQVALKILHPHLAAKETERQRFMSEASAASCLHHPGVIRVYDIDESIFAIAMEHLSGGTLKERISGGVSPREALAFCREVATTLAFIHERGFIHRDLKPANLLFRAAGSEGSAGRLVLTDFGVAYLGGEKEKGVVGTLAYMSPEQRKGAEVTLRSDLYALGVILYESLTGKLPYTPEEITRGVVHFPLQAATERLPQGLRPRATALLRALLSPDPKDRPESAKQVETELRHLTNIFDLREDATAIFLDAISVAKTQSSLRPETRRVLLRAAAALGLSQEETINIASQNGLSSQEVMLLAAEMGSESL